MRLGRPRTLASANASSTRSGRPDKAIYRQSSTPLLLRPSKIESCFACRRTDVRHVHIQTVRIVRQRRQEFILAGRRDGGAEKQSHSNGPRATARRSGKMTSAKAVDVYGSPHFGAVALRERDVVFNLGRMRATRRDCLIISCQPGA